jgi:hypothetical protein
MGSVEGPKPAPRKRGGHGAASNKRAANLYAKSLPPTISELRAAGHTTPRAISDELSKRKIPAARGGKWHPTTVVRLLARLD